MSQGETRWERDMGEVGEYGEVILLFEQFLPHVLCEIHILNRSLICFLLPILNTNSALPSSLTFDTCSFRICGV